VTFAAAVSSLTAHPHDLEEPDRSSWPTLILMVPQSQIQCQVAAPPLVFPALPETSHRPNRKDVKSINLGFFDMTELYNDTDGILEHLYKQIMRDEGCVLHAYECTRGAITIGYGRMIDEKFGGGITREEAAYLLGNDIQRVTRELQSSLPWVIRLSEPRMGVLMNMCFQLGLAGLLKFKNTLALIRGGRYDEAAAEMLDSTWAKQTPERARRLALQMRTDTWQ
jgi:lysozyme